MASQSGTKRMAGGSQPPRQREGFLDLLRFIAALFVVFYHYGFRGHAQGGFLTLNFPELSFTRYGYLGVEVFFMISGYVILWSISGRGVLQFAVYRFIRLYPTFWLCALITLVTEHLLSMAGFYPGLRSAIVNITMVPSWFGMNQIDGVYWTLAVELKFYVLTALVVALIGAEHLDNALLGWLILGYAFGGFRHPSFFLCDSFYPYFCFGGACCLIHRMGCSAKLIAVAVCSICLCVNDAIAGASAWILYYRVPFSPVVCVAIILFAGVMILSANRISSLLSPRANSAALILGGLTYPLYLLHEMIGFSIMDRYFRQSDRWVGLIVTVFVMITAAAAIYFLFDRPVRAKLKIIADSRLAVVPPRAVCRTGS